MIQPNFTRGSDFSAQQARNQDGFYLNELSDGTALEIETQHHHYKLVKGADTHVRISGHPTFCPEPVDVELEGSFGERPPIKPRPGYIGRGMYLVFKHPQFNEITTSRIREVHKLA